MVPKHRLDRQPEIGMNQVTRLDIEADLTSAYFNIEADFYDIEANLKLANLTVTVVVTVTRGFATAKKKQIFLNPLKGPNQNNLKLEVEEKASSLNKSQKPLQYRYKRTNILMMILIITITMRIIEVNPEAIDLTEAKLQVNFSEVKICVVEVNAIKTCTKAMVVGPIIEAITTTNTISIVVMMMSTRQINMAHHVHYVVAIITPPNIVLRENMISMTSGKDEY